MTFEFTDSGPFCDAGYPADQRPAYVDLRIRGRTRVLARTLTGWGEERLVLTLGVRLIPGLAAGLIDWVETPLSDERPQTPTITFRRDLRLLYVKTLAAGAAAAVALGVLDAVTVGTGRSYGLAYGLSGGLLLTLTFGLLNGVMTAAVLRAQGRVPPHLLSLLDDAHRLGILRQAGPVYQFRHAKLHDHLAQTYALPT